MDEFLEATDEEVEEWEKMILKLRAEYEDVARQRGRLPIKQIKSLYKSVRKRDKSELGLIYK